MNTPKPVSRRPYLLRAMYEWINDSQLTPHVIVDAEGADVDVPRQYVKDGKIVLNLSPAATQGLQMGSEWLEFNARFSGVTRHLRIPLKAVMGIYAQETNEGMIFNESDWVPGPPEPKPPAGEDARRARFKVVK